MNLERTILIAVWMVTIVLLLLTVNRRRIREAWLIFLFKQIPTWFLGIIVVQYGLVAYPVREFPYAMRNSFSFEYFIYPAICVVFNMRFPENRPWYVKLLWYLFFPSWMTGLEVLIEEYTRLIEYEHWGWYMTWLGLLSTFWMSRRFYLWYFRKDTLIPRPPAWRSGAAADPSPRKSPTK